MIHFLNLYVLYIGITENLSPCINIAVDFLFNLPKYSVIPINLISFLKIDLFIGIVIRSNFVKFDRLLDILI